MELPETAFLVLSVFLACSFDCDAEGFGNLATNVCTGLFIVFGLFARLSRGSFELHPVAVLFLPFFCFCMASILWFADVATSVKRVRSPALMAARHLALSNCLLARPEDSSRLNLMSRLLASAHALAIGDWSPGDRVAGVIGEANRAGAFLTRSLSVALCCASRGLSAVLARRDACLRDRGIGACQRLTHGNCGDAGWNLSVLADWRDSAGS